MLKSADEKTFILYNGKEISYNKIKECIQDITPEGYTPVWYTSHGAQNVPSDKLMFLGAMHKKGESYPIHKMDNDAKKVLMIGLCDEKNSATIDIEKFMSEFNPEKVSPSLFSSLSEFPFVWCMFYNTLDFIPYGNSALSFVKGQYIIAGITIPSGNINLYCGKTPQYDEYVYSNNPELLNNLGCINIEQVPQCTYLSNRIPYDLNGKALINDTGKLFDRISKYIRKQKKPMILKETMGSSYYCNNNELYAVFSTEESRKLPRFDIRIFKVLKNEHRKMRSNLGNLNNPFGLNGLFGPSACITYDTKLVSLSIAEGNFGYSIDFGGISICDYAPEAKQAVKTGTISDSIYIFPLLELFPFLSGNISIEYLQLFIKAINDYFRNYPEEWLELKIHLENRRLKPISKKK